MSTSIEDLRQRIEALDRQQRRSHRIMCNVNYAFGTAFGYITGTHRWLEGITMGAVVFAITFVLHWLTDRSDRIRWTIR